jgi:hypothetical protein
MFEKRIREQGKGPSGPQRKFENKKRGSKDLKEIRIKN